ncbi:MAG: V-type ATPase 116kDa subunit family protein [Nitrospirota bacterium]
MSKISIIGPKKSLHEVMDTVFRAGVLHVESAPDIIKGTPFVDKVALTIEQKKELAELERLSSIARKTINILSPKILMSADTTVKQTAISIEKTKAFIEEAGNTVESLNSDIRKLEQQLLLYRRYEKVLTALYPLIEIIPESAFMDYTGITLYKKEASLPLLEDALQGITYGRHELFKKDIDGETTACIVVYPKEFSQKIKAILHEENISEIVMPFDLSETPMIESVKIILQKTVTLTDGIQELERTLHQFACEEFYVLSFSSRIIEQEIEQIQVISELYGTKNTFFLYGWLPSMAIKSFMKTINERFHDIVVSDVVPATPEERENIPVILSNPRLIRPFEILTKFLALPRYGTFDPTPLLAIFFPVFFGLILGDIGYGIIAFMASLWVIWRWRKNEFVRDLGSILMVSTFAAIIFGFIFGEFFGNLGELIGIHPLIDRSKSLIPFLIFTILIGGLHISIGLVIGIIVAINSRETKNAITRSLKLLFVFTLYGIAASYYGLLPQSMRDIMVISGLVMVGALIFVEKWLAPFEAMKLVVNILSYSRIMGFGAASIFLASIANRLSAMPRNIFIGIIIGIFFHLINLALGLYAPAIQTLRLNYVEFFDKFFYPGGKEYKPWGRVQGGKERW